MGWVPFVRPSPCKCGSIPSMRKKWFSFMARMECECGISGSWVDCRDSFHPENAALSGWPFQSEIKPPHPSKK